MSAALNTHNLYCCGCSRDVSARLTDGCEVYPHRPDLHGLPFWKCDTCGNHVGCHHKTSDRTRPLGVIPTPEMKRARQHIHAILDPLWKSGHLKRGQVYARLQEALGHPYHTAELRTIEEARTVYRAVQSIQGRGNTAPHA
jgi:hypothetical protein